MKIIDERNKIYKSQNYIHDDGEMLCTSFVSGKAIGRQIASFVSGSTTGQLTLLLYPV